MERKERMTEMKKKEHQQTWFGCSVPVCFLLAISDLSILGDLGADLSPRPFLTDTPLFLFAGFFLLSGNYQRC